MKWVCNDCIPGCTLQGVSNEDDPPEVCPWAHNREPIYDRDDLKANWKAVQE